MLIGDFNVIRTSAVTLEMWFLKLWCIFLCPGILKGVLLFFKINIYLLYLDGVVIVEWNSFARFRKIGKSDSYLLHVCLSVLQH